MPTYGYDTCGISRGNPLTKNVSRIGVESRRLGINQATASGVIILCVCVEAVDFLKMSSHVVKSKKNLELAGYCGVAGVPTGQKCASCLTVNYRSAFNFSCFSRISSSKWSVKDVLCRRSGNVPSSLNFTSEKS